MVAGPRGFGKVVSQSNEDGIKNKQKPALLQSTSWNRQLQDIAPLGHKTKYA